VNTLASVSDKPVRTKPLARRTLRVGSPKQLSSLNDRRYDGGLMAENSLFRIVKIFHRLTILETASFLLILVLSP
jgi:hypothetical protein